MNMLLATLLVTALLYCEAQRQGLRPDLRQGRGCVVDRIEMCRYESHQEMISKLRDLQLQYPQLAKVGVLCYCPSLRVFVLKGEYYWEVRPGPGPGLHQDQW